MDDDNFKFYNDEESRQLKSSLKQMLGNINSLITKFMKTYDSNSKLQNEIQTMIYQDKIYHHKKKIANFNTLLKNASESVNLDEIEERKKKTVMGSKRAEEIGKVKEFVQGNFLKMLPEDPMNNNKKELADKNLNTEKNLSHKIEIKIENKTNSNILFVPNKGSQQYDDKTINIQNLEDDDDIKVEFLGKKHNKEKKQKGNQNERSSVVFQSCYTCKKKFTKDNLHFFYTNLCSTCGNYNYSFRELQVDMTGRIAVVTGGRVKIGYYIVLKLLNYGCKVISTTRFPKDSLLRFKQESNYNEFKDRLIIYPIDFRLFESTEKFIKYLNDTLPHLDILINNAAQTVRRTTSYYKYLLQIEGEEIDREDDTKIVKNDIPSGKINPSVGSSTALTLFNSNNQLRKKEFFSNEKKLPMSVIASQIKIMNEEEGPQNTMMGPDGQPIDFSQSKSSWNMELDEVPFQEFAEVQIINSWTPYYLCVKLKPLMEKSPFKDRYIVNVSSVEGIFNHFKRTTHPHTNMAKAALNMMTRTCGRYYKDSGIYMTAADTGWVSPMNEFNNLFKSTNTQSFENEYKNIPLDELDGAMRVIHPIIEGVKNKNYIYGYLLKDYKITNW
jgi:NAD(P)-dependent dehydrogenase (short-subunit alcohol dehydrogenase family)